AIGGQPVLLYGFGDVFHGHAGEQFDSTGESDRMHEPHLHVSEARRTKQSGDAWTDVGVGSPRFHRLRVELDELLQGAAVRLREVSTEIDVLDDHDTVWTSVAMDRTDQRSWIGEVRQEKPGIDDVELFVWLPPKHVPDFERDIRKTVFLRFAPR